MPGPVLRNQGMTKSTQRNDLRVLTTTVEIGGMSCGACVDRIINVLSGLSGVLDVNVDLTEHNAVVDHLAVWPGEQALVSALEGAGYLARVAETTGGHVGPSRVVAATPSGSCCR